LTCPFDFWLLIFNFIPLPLNKKASRLGGFRFLLYVIPALWFSSIAPRLTGRQAKEKEEKIKEASLSLHFELHETR
jgi:hypothetical protein